MSSRRAPDFAALLARLTRALTEHELPFMLIGGQAVLLHGEPRLTQDVDLTLAVPPTDLDRVLHACETAALEPLPEDVEEFVRETFVLPAEDVETGVRVDLIFSTTSYEAQAVARSVEVDVGGTAVPFASAEDLILHKLFAGRPRDLEDARGVARVQGGSLDWTYMRRWAERFAEIPDRETMPVLLRELEGRGTG